MKRLWDWIKDLFRPKPPTPPGPTPPVEPVHPRNDNSKKCEWSEACGAPDVLYPNFSYGLRWVEEKKDEKPTGRGSWQFYYIGGGHGLYKPHEWDADGNVTGNNRLWLLPESNPLNGQPFLIEHIGRLEEILPSGEVRPKGKPTGYFGNLIIVRDAIPTMDGATLQCVDVYNQVVFQKTIVNRKCRQE